jgi:hypothetical protein
MGEIRSEYKILVGKAEEKRPIGRPTRLWEDLSERLKCVDRMHLAKRRDQWRFLVNIVINFWVS